MDNRLQDFREPFLSSITRLLSVSPHWNTQHIHLHIMVNPAAGGLMNPEGRRALLSGLEDALAPFGDKPILNTHTHDHMSLYESAEPGELVELVKTALENDRGTQVFLSLGGDGTHQEVLTGLQEYTDPAQKKRVLLCRLPCGTGNDGFDVSTWEEAVELLHNAPGMEGEPTPAVRVTTAQGKVGWAGNISGLGMDAYVVHLSHKYKDKLPGKAYKIAADIGVLFYQRTFKLKPAKMTIGLADGTFQEFSLLPGIVSFGASGYRTYGQGLPVFPDKENICLIPVGSVFQNLKLKKQLFQGQHPSNPRVTMVMGKTMKVEYSGRLPMQKDGEVSWLEPEDFPITFETKELGIRLIRSHNSSAVQRNRQTLPVGLLTPSLGRYRDNA